MVDPATGKAHEPEPGACGPRRTPLPRPRCDPAAEAWCRRGAVVSADRGAAPVLLAHRGTNLTGVKWSHFYRGITDDIRCAPPGGRGSVDRRRSTP